MLIPGAGYIYCKQIPLGLCIVFFVSVAILLLKLGFPYMFIFVLIVPIYICMVFDSFIITKRYNKKLDKEQTQE
jgi:ABC-type bacteriocin/lantibiotic exporter with double-glycine peptidase domain